MNLLQAVWAVGKRILVAIVDFLIVSFSVLLLSSTNPYVRATSEVLLPLAIIVWIFLEYEKLSEE